MHSKLNDILMVNIFLIRVFLRLFQLWYEAIRDISVGSELLLPQKVPLHLRDVYSEGFEDRSDRETGTQNIFFIITNYY